MGTKYTSQSSSGYDTGAPPDDGTTGTGNKVNWAIIKTALTNVLKTFTEAINTQLVAYFDFDTNAHSSAHTTDADDNGRTLEVTGTTTIKLGAPATLTTGHTVTVKCVSGTTTVDPQTYEVDGSTTDRTLTAGKSETYVVNAGADKYLLKAEVTDPITTRGDVVVGNSSGLSSRLAVGTTGQVLTADGTDAAWATQSWLQWTYLDTFDTTSSTTLGANTSIPSTTTKIAFVVSLLSMNGAGKTYIELGDSGGYSNTINGGVGSGLGDVVFSSGLYQFHRTGDANAQWNGVVEFTKLNGSDKWVGSANIADGNATSNQNVSSSGGTITLAGTLDRCRITNSVSNFDAGQVDVYTYS